jgi:hypothetical protein
MQIIQSIREKGAAIVIIVIALSLISFILMDAKQGGNKLFGSLSNNVGSVNGEEIELATFNSKVKEAEDMQEQRYGQRPSGQETYQLRDRIWDQLVAEKIFFKEAENMGISFTSKELSYILLSNEQSNPFLQEQSLKDSLTGLLDISKAQTALNNIKKLKGEQRASVNSQIIDPLKLNTTVAKYSALLSSSAYYPSWLKDKDQKESETFSTISYVAIPYSEISDDKVKVTGDDVARFKEVLKSMGLGHQGGDAMVEPAHDDSCYTCGGTPCQCDELGAEVVGLPGKMEMEIDEADAPVSQNSPDYPTNQEESDDALQYSGGLDGPKSTGQTTIPVVASQEDRLHTMEESFDSFLNLYKTFKTK